MKDAERNKHAKFQACSFANEALKSGELNGRGNSIYLAKLVTKGGNFQAPGTNFGKNALIIPGGCRKV